jgi:hypothetical protein
MSLQAARPGNLDDLIEWISALSAGDFRYELTKLRAIRDWAYKQAGIGFGGGDRVRIRDGYAVSRLNRDGSPSGWWHYRECLTGGATGTAAEIDFSPHRENWYASIRLDREWSVSETGGRDIRRWHGPAGSTPAGYEPPSAYDREHYPDGRRHVFCMNVADLEKVP